MLMRILDEGSETVKIIKIKNMELGLSDDVIEGLKMLGKDLEMGKKLITNTVKQLITKEPSKFYQILIL